MIGTRLGIRRQRPDMGIFRHACTLAVRLILDTFATQSTTIQLNTSATVLVRVLPHWHGL